MKSDQDYAKQIVALEWHADALREQRALALPGSTEQERIVDLLELVSSTLTKLRAQRQTLNARPPVRPVRRFAPITREPARPVARGFSSAPPPVGHLALALPAVQAFLDRDVVAPPPIRPMALARDADLVFETVWTPHRDAPSLIGEYERRG